MAAIPNIYVKLIGPGEPIRLTNTPDANEVMPQWSPDGKWIAFRRSTLKQTVAAVIPALGGPERFIALDRGTSVSWTADSHWIAYVSGNPSGLYLSSLDGSEKRPVIGPLQSKYPVFGGIFSPDSRKLALVCTVGRHVPVYVVGVSADYKPQGEPKALTPLDWDVYSAAWTADGKEILFIRGGGGNVGLDTAMYRVSAVGGAPRRVQFAGDNPWLLGVARQGHRMAFTRMHRDMNIYRAEIGKDGTIHGSGEAIASSSRADIYPVYSPDGARIAFGSNRGGSMEIWVTQADGRNPVQLTNSVDPDHTQSPQWSPDGSWIAYVAMSKSKPSLNIFMIPASGGAARAVTDDDNNLSAPMWSHDGHWIYFVKSSNIWKVEAGGGQAVQITREGGTQAQESPDGKWLYFLGPGGVIRRMPPAGGEAAEFARDSLSFWVSTRGLYFFGNRNRGVHDSPIMFVGHAGGAPKVIGSVQRRIAPGISVSPDDRYLLYSQDDQAAAELMLVENFR